MTEPITIHEVATRFFLVMSGVGMFATVFWIVQYITKKKLVPNNKKHDPEVTKKSVVSSGERDWREHFKIAKTWFLIGALAGIIFTLAMLKIVGGV